MHQLMTRARKVRPLLLMTYDSACWVFAFVSVGAVQVAVGYSTADVVPKALAAGALSALLFAVLGLFVRVHHGRATLGSFHDALLVTLVSASTTAVVGVGNLAIGNPLRVSVTVLGPCFAYALIMGARASYRLLREWLELRVSTPMVAQAPVVVVGAGVGGTQLVQAMQRDPSCPWRPVALLDDDPSKRHRRTGGVPVVGTTSELEAVASRLEADTVILAVPSATSELVRQFSRRATSAGLELKVVPGARDLVNPAQLQIQDVRDIQVTDFLGRQPIETDVDSIAGYVLGKRVLVTGAGGSIGSELCRQLSAFGPAELIMLDRDESALHAVQLSLTGRAMLDEDDTALVDIRDAKAVRELFEQRRPQVVFHAAALKHLPLLEAAPGEAVKTNVWGTQTLLEVAASVGVERFVNVSTDKAANPCSVLGYSKRLAEGLTSAADLRSDGAYLSVRFGNVLGSRGSVLTTFTAQIANGGPVTVTDPRVTRYFMTIREAVQLVIQAGAIGGGGDVLVLDMGEPVRIGEVADQLIDMSGQAVSVAYTGLREGEKLHEELFGHGEPDFRPCHDLISHVPVPPLPSEQVARLKAYDAPHVIRRDLAELTAQIGSGAALVTRSLPSVPHR